MPLVRLPLLAALALALNGCAVIAPFLPEGQPRIEIAPLDEGDLLVTTGDVGRAYDEVAILVVGPRGDGETDALLADLRQAAREIGADAVVRVDFEVYGGGENGFTRWSATGTAVRFAD